MAFIQVLTDQFLQVEAQRYKSRARKSREPVRKRRGSEKSRIFTRVFSVNGPDFDQMDQGDFVDKYLSEVVKVFPLWLESTLGRSYCYFRFDLDVDTSTRKTFALDEGDVFVSVKVQRTAVLTHPPGGYQDEVVVTIKAEIREEDEDPDPPSVVVAKALDSEMLSRNQKTKRILEK